MKCIRHLSTIFHILHMARILLFDKGVYQIHCFFLFVLKIINALAVIIAIFSHMIFFSWGFYGDYFFALEYIGYVYS